MPSGDGQSADFLDRLKTFLSGVPERPNAGLRGMLEELGSYQGEPGKHTVEKAFEVFGTAAGKQSTMQTAKTFNCGSQLTGRRSMANTL